MRRIGILQCKSSLSWSRYNHAYSQYLSENEEIRLKKMASAVACNTSPSINIKHKKSMIREISSCSIVPSLVSQNIHKKKVSNFKNITSPVTPIHNQLCQNYYQKSFFSSGKTYSSIGNSTLDFKNDDVRKFLDQEKIKYNESRHCNDYVIVQVPKNILTGGDTPTKWDKDSLTDVFIFKSDLADSFVIPEFGLGGRWLEIKDFLSTWTNEARGPFPQTKLPTLSSNLPNDYDIQKIQDILNNSIPVKNMDQSEFENVMQSFRLSLKHFKKHIFEQMDAHIHQVSESTKPEILFPIRFIDERGQLIGLKRIYLSEDSKKIEEENLGSHSPFIDKAGQLTAFPQGLDRIYTKRNEDFEGNIKVKSVPVVIVDSVLDSIILADASIYAVVIDNKTGLPPLYTPFFEDFSKITFWSGNKNANSRDRVEKMAKDLGVERCYAVKKYKYPPREWVIKKENDAPGKEQSKKMQNIIEKEAMPFVHAFIETSDAFYEDILYDLRNPDQNFGTRWKRFSKLNDYLRGFRRGELTVISGRTGSGKTTFLSEYSVDLAEQGIRTLWGSFEVKNKKLVMKQIQQHVGVNLEDEFNKDPESFMRYAKKFRKLGIKYLKFHGAENVTKVLDAMGHAVHVFDVEHVLIDNLQFMLGSSGYSSGLDKFSDQDRVIEQFRRFATLHNCHVTLVVHPRKEDTPALTVQSIYGGAKATQEADNVLLLQETEIPNAKTKLKTIEIAKNRDCGDLGSILLSFHKPTTTFSGKFMKIQKKKDTSVSSKRNDNFESNNPKNHEDG